MPNQLAMPAALRAVPHASWRAGERAVMMVEAVGHRVPRRHGVARVHSVFARACNIACGDALLALVGPEAGHGPTLLCMSTDTPHDLRRWFDVGEPVRCAPGGLRTARADIRFDHARTWRPAPLRAPLPSAQLLLQLQRAKALLVPQRRQHGSVIERDAAATAGALIEACRVCDGAVVARQTQQLIGWGEGLTPAGDDFVVGVCAGLDALLRGEARRQACRAAIGAAMIASMTRTTAISAHYLRLAADGHYNERLLAARDGLLGDPSWPRVHAALRAACAIGATSGRDTMAGLLAALCAWLPHTDNAAAAA